MNYRRTAWSSSRFGSSAVLALILALSLMGCAVPTPVTEPTMDTVVDEAQPAPAEIELATPSPSATELLSTPAPIPLTPTEPAPAANATPTPPPTAAPTPVSSRVRVAETEGQGANLRQEPSSEARVLRVLREGTELTLIGPDREAEERTWRNVRDDEGTGGWVAAEVLQVVLPTPTPTTAEIAAPCRVGQLKGDATEGVYYLPDHPSYGSIKERVRCFDSESQARATGYRAP
jgi:Bacterial SH3 domain